MDINICEIDTTKKEDRLKLGAASENNLLEELQKINPNITTINDPYCPIDYMLDLENTLILFELKTRKFSINTYDTTIIGINKINYVDNLNTTKNKKFICVFGFISSGMKIDYHFIVFNRTLFKTFSTKLIFNKKHLEIPVNLLQPLYQLGATIKSL